MIFWLSNWRVKKGEYDVSKNYLEEKNYTFLLSDMNF